MLSRYQNYEYLPEKHVLVSIATVVNLIGRALLAVVVTWVVHLL